MSKFWCNNAAGQPDIFPTQIVYDCFICDKAFIGDIDHCPHCGNKLHQLYPFWGTGVRECVVIPKGR